MEKLLNILQGFKPGVQFEGRTDLVDSGDIDSLIMVMLVVAINDQFDVAIKPTDIVPANFNSLESMMDLITGLQAEN